MPDINWSKNASAITGPGAAYTSFSLARQAEESAFNSNNTTASNIVGSGIIRSGGRGATSYGVRRTYFAFDFTGYTSGTITNLAFHFTPTGTSSGTLSNRIAQFEGFGESTTFNDYSATSWWSDITNPLVPYSSAFNIIDGSTAASVSLNSTAITDAGTDGYLQIVLMNAGDYNNVPPVSDGTNLSYLDQSSNKSFLRFTYVAGGYSNNINGILSSNFTHVNSIEIDDIEAINAVT